MRLSRLLAAAAVLACGAASAANLAEISARVASATGMAPSSVRPAPVAGLFEVSVGRQVFYADENVRYLIAGEIYDVRAKKNLTEERLAELSRVDVRSLPLQDAFKVVYGTGERTLVVFTDANCRYCSVLENSIARMGNVTVYNFLYPILDSREISRRIVCDKDPAEALRRHQTEGYEPPAAPASCDDSVLDRNLRLGRMYSLTSTPTIVFPDGSMFSGAMTASQLENALSSRK